ncbi:hypothetical protein FISHEDRAFT_56618 [Fistulina hepatica ATCC 64428]|uniref:Uncharacterized protein n=1 Tax=Fistulina hepatica ATCC 64428 TaxID=1128425 RepID=A0A0D7AI98_9AGAR|nr:hypothetical protein FISHEDRAFT_56618 [Fistulina hepatica ATCC 64428]
MRAQTGLYEHPSLSQSDIRTAFETTPVVTRIAYIFFIPTALGLAYATRKYTGLDRMLQYHTSNDILPRFGVLFLLPFRSMNHGSRAVTTFQGFPRYRTLIHNLAGVSGRKRVFSTVAKGKVGDMKPVLWVTRENRLRLPNGIVVVATEVGSAERKAMHDMRGRLVK